MLLKNTLRALSEGLDWYMAKKLVVLEISVKLCFS